MANEVKLEYARAPSEDSAKVVLFGADTRAAGHSQSYVGQVLRQDFADEGDFSADRIRSADNESPSLPENGRTGVALFDRGNLTGIGGSPEAQARVVADAFTAILRNGKIPIVLGGDHLVKAGGLAAVAARRSKVGVLYLDAHPDCLELPQLRYDSILHHAFQGGISPEKTVILGLRQFTSEEWKGVERYGPTLVRGQAFTDSTLSEIKSKIRKAFAGCESIYVSIDLDGLDPTSAPAVEAPYPGGPSTAQLLSVLRDVLVAYPLAAMDISEFVPRLDPFRLTALTAVRILKEVYSCVA